MQTSSRLIYDITSMVTDRLVISETVQIKTSSIEMKFLRNNATNLEKVVNIQNARISLSSFCDFISSNDSCESTIIRQRVISVFKNFSTKKFNYLNRLN